MTQEEVAILVARRMGSLVPARLRFQALVDDGLSRLAVKVAQDVKMRPYLITPLLTTTATLDSSGIADLSTLVSSNQVLIDYLQYGQIYHSSSAYPLQWVGNSAQGKLPNRFDKMLLTCWLVGQNLYAKGFNQAPLTGALSFAVPFIPTLAQLPSNLSNNLVDKVTELLIESPKDYAEDSAK